MALGRVLVVSTSEMTRTSIVRALTNNGYQAEPLDKLDSARALSLEPALVVLQCTILGDPELAFMRAIKPTPVVLIVRRGDFNDARNALVRHEGGAYDVLQSSLYHPAYDIVEFVLVTFMRLPADAARA